MKHTLGELKKRNGYSQEHDAVVELTHLDYERKFEITSSLFLEILCSSNVADVVELNHLDCERKFEIISS